MRLPRQDLLVVGIGNPLRCDDTAGLHLARRLREQVPGLEVVEVTEMDLGLAEPMAAHEHLLILDATSDPWAKPFRLVDLVPDERVQMPPGYVSHTPAWSFLLAVARDLFGRAPRARLLAVAGESFEIGEELSAACAARCDEALAFLLEDCTRPESPPDAPAA